MEQPLDEKPHHEHSPSFFQNRYHEVTVQSWDYDIKCHLKSATYEGNPDIYVPRIRNVLDQVMIARNHLSTYIMSRTAHFGGI